MHNALNGLVFDSIAETASEINDLGGLQALSVLLGKLGGRPGFVTQPERFAAAKKMVETKIVSIKE